MTKEKDNSEHMDSLPRIDIVPDKALVDEQVTVRFSGLERNQAITLRARMRDGLERRWEAHATFKTDDHGVIDVSSQAPLSGSYDGVDPMGLFWSMTLNDAEKEPSRFARQGLTPLEVSFLAEVDGRRVASASLKRLHVAPGVTRTPVRENGLVGTFFEPPASAPRPGVIVMGGSGGGLNEDSAALLASHGYAAMALAYFNCEHLPANLYNIPLEYFATAIRWMQAQTGVIGDKLAVMGWSRGGELSLVLGATYPEIKVVVAYVPSAVVHGGIGSDASAKPKPAWIYRGEPLPFLRRKETVEDFRKQFVGKPIPLTPLFLKGLEDQAAVEEATIPVEKVNGPVLLISGQDDQMWPSSKFSEMVVERLAKHKHPYPYRHLAYAGAGHLIKYPYVPTTVAHARHPVRGEIYAFGGNPKDNAFANSDSWPQVLEFLGESLRG